MELQEFVTKSAVLWTREYEESVINILKLGKTGKSLPREAYHILKTFSLVTFGGIQKVAKHNGKYMATKNDVVNIIRTMHIETGHGGEKKTHKKLQDMYANIPRSLVQEYIKHCERCAEKRCRQETASGVVIRPLSVKDLNDRGQVDLIDMQTMKDGN